MFTVFLILVLALALINFIIRTTHPALPWWWELLTPCKGWYIVQTQDNPAKPVFWTGTQFEDRLGVVPFQSIIQVKKAL